MPAYAFDTSTSLQTALTGNNIDSTTAAQIANFLSANGKFKDNSAEGGPAGVNTVLVEGPTALSGADSTPNVDVYEISNADFNSSALVTLPSAGAIVDTNAGSDTIDIFGSTSDVGDNGQTPDNNNLLLAAGDSGNFINLHSSTGNDTVLAGNGANTVYAGAGTELIYLGSGNSSINASSATGDITIYGYASIASDGGNDFYQLQGGTNTIYTSDGANTINAFAGDNIINLGSGADSINGYSAGISSSSDHDTVNLGSGSDTVVTGDGLWSVTGGTGTDDIQALNDGSSTIDLSGTTAANLVQLQAGTNSVVGGNFGNQFNIFGGTDTVTGGGTSNAVHNIFDAYTSSAESLVGGGGYNLFNLGTQGGTANDTVVGGTGANEININAASGSVSIDGATSGNSVDFTQYASTDETDAGHNPIVNPNGSDTYHFGTGPNTLTVTITNPSDTTIKFGH